MPPLQVLPSDRYFRFNPRMEIMPIDDTEPAKLERMKRIAREYADAPETAARLDELARVLRPRPRLGSRALGAPRAVLRRLRRPCGRAAAAADDDVDVDDPSRRLCYSYGDVGIGMIQR